jgi:hypothetical protein
VCADFVDLHIGVCYLYLPAHRCVLTLQTCTSVCSYCTGLHIGVYCFYRPAHWCLLTLQAAHRCVLTVQNCTSVFAESTACTSLFATVQTCTSVCAVYTGCTSVFAVSTDLHIGVCSTQYILCNTNQVRPYPKTNKVNPMQAINVYFGFGECSTCSQARL